MGIFLDKPMILDRIKEHYSLKNNADLARFLGVAPNTITNWYGRKTFDLDIIYTKCVGVDFNWLLTGEGSMLREDEVQQPIQPTSATSDAVSLRLMDRLEEKDSKIDQLQSELRTMEKELFALKTIHSQFQDKESEHKSRISEAMEAFTLESSGGSGEDFLPTKPPTTSKRLSAGKM